MRTHNQLRKPRGRLTDKQNRFAEQYIVDLNANAAAVGAGFSPRQLAACHRLASEIVTCSRALQELQAERNQRVQVDADWVLRRLEAELEADASDLFDDDGTVKPVASGRKSGAGAW